MCGIVGVLGDHEAAPLLVEALKRLEYRGYDSAGIATVQNGMLDRRRAVGKLVNLSDQLVHAPLAGKAGIGHTRWATHGGPSLANAHPHRAGRVAVVHNGIIENFRALRTELSREGGAFESETDTETVARLAEHYLAAGAPPREAAARTIARLEGAFALAFVFEGHDDLIVAARRGSPLAIGHGDGEMFVGSDAIALAPLTRRITYLEEGDIAHVTREGAEVLDADGSPVARQVTLIAPEMAQIDKGGHRHFMAKEIFEQPTVLSDCLTHYARDGRVVLPADLDFTDTDRLVMVACGTAHYACMVAKYWFEGLAGLVCDVDIASEYRYRDPLLHASTTALFVSQSGETADTLAALRHAGGRAGRTVAVVNVAESSIARDAQLALPILAGREIGVASTKAFLCQLGVLANLAILAARQRGRIDAETEARLLADLHLTPALLNQALALNDAIAQATQPVSAARTVLFLGRGKMFPMALEGALKLKEISYIHAEGYASGELKHGPIALVDEDVPVIVFAPRDALFDKTVSNMHEVMAREGKVVLVTDRGGAEIAGAETWQTITMPAVDPLWAPLVYAVPAQLIAYHVACHKGTDVDQPRNLAKSVTVE